MMIYLALLRGINVGGKRKIPMNKLAEVFEEAGYNQIKTYIQSGNVVFDSHSRISTELTDSLETFIKERFGFPVPVVLRTTEQLRQVVRRNPLIGAGGDERLLHVLFLADLPSSSCINGLDSNRSAPDTFIACGQEIYLRLPNGVAQTKLTSPYFDSKLKTVGTMRNWHTVISLLELMEERESKV